MEPHHQEEINKNAGEISETDLVGGAYKVAANVKVRPIGAMGTMAARLTLIYVVVAALWILVSDQVLVALVSDHTLLMKLEVMKGWAFVSVTAALLFFLMRRETGHWMAEKGAREKAEAVMHESEVRFRQLFDLAPLPVVFFGRDGLAANFNDCFKRVLGYTPEDLPTLERWLLLAHPDENERREAVARWEGAVARALKDETNIAPEEFAITCKNGDVRTFLLSGTILREGILVTFVDITERKNSEAALRESQEQATFLASILESSAQPFATGHPDGRLGRFNAAFSKLLGYTDEELRSLLWQDLTPPEWHLIEKAKLAELQSSGQPIRYEKEYIRKDGMRVPVEGFVHLVRNERGQPAYYYAFITDLTDRKRNESALRRSEAQSRAVVQSAPDAIFIQTKGCFTFLNPMAVQLFGAVDDKQLIGVPVVERYHPDCRELLLERIRQNNTERVAVPVVVQKILRCDGTVIEAEVSAVPFTYRNEAGALVFARDITERKKAMEALRESEERFRQVVENMNEVFWMTDPVKNQMLYVSPAYKRIWGRETKDLFGGMEHWSETIHPDDRKRVVDALLSKAAAREYDETYRILRPDGVVRWIHDHAFPIRNQAGRVYRVVGMATDITEQRTLEDQLRQAQKMEAIGTLAGGIAHDFNNILGAISGFAELAKMDATSPPIHNSLDEILKACKRAGDLVRQILAFSRRQEQKRLPLQLWRIVDEATRLLRAALPATIQFDIDLSSDAPAVLAEPTQIHQIVMNLCTNAAHAMSGRPGVLGVKLDRFEADEEFVALHHGSRPGWYVRLTVSDNGHGMDRATLDRIFEPFYTTKAPGEGTGLGLSVVHGIVRNHDGIVTVYSQPGKGTTFHIYFPAHEGGTAELAVDSAPAPRGHGERILVVDDEVALVHMTERVLKRLDYVVDTATDPERAREAIRAEPKKYDLVLTDLTMPGLSGLELASFALNANPDIKVILMTGYFANVSTDQVSALGIKEVLMKPISIRSMAQIIGRVLGQPKPN
jgi:PAS domain S-box-containing protein